MHQTSEPMTIELALRFKSELEQLASLSRAELMSLGYAGMEGRLEATLRGFVSIFRTQVKFEKCGRTATVELPRRLQEKLATR